MATRSRTSSASTQRASLRGAPPRGATAVVVALVLVLLLGFLALALDSGHLFSVRGELQNAVDAGALAGAVELDGTTAGLEPAVASGLDFAARHETDSHEDVVANQVELGHWTLPYQDCASFEGVETGRNGPDGYRFCRIEGRDAIAARLINAVRVQAARAKDAPGGGGAPVFLHAFLGHGETADVAAEAVAVKGGPSTEKCPTAPLTIRADCLEDNGGALRCGEPYTPYTLGLSDATIDSAGWVTFNTQDITNETICDAFQGTGQCAVTEGQLVQTGNGNQFSSKMCKAPEGTNITFCEWFARSLGKDMQVPVVEYPGDTKGCYSGGYSGLARVVGFATFRIAEVYCKGKGTPAPTTGPCAGYATDQCIVIHFICGVEDPEPAPPGGGWWGTSATRPQLTR
jgi:putative Flp pilus-assembly TadE/G-like protein